MTAIFFIGFLANSIYAIILALQLPMNERFCASHPWIVLLEIILGILLNIFVLEEESTKNYPKDPDER